MFSVPGVIASVVASKVASNIFGGKEPAPQPTQVIFEQPPQAPRAQETNSFGKFLEYLPPILESIPRYEPPTQQEIILKLPEETKESGQMENGPQVYQGAAGALVPFAQQLGRTLFGGGARGAIGGTIGGALIGQGVQQFMGGADACGCGPKPFVRMDRCGRPIITRAMQKKAKEMVMCMGIEGAAQALGVPVPLLAEIAFKQFKPRAKGISGAQLRNAKRVNRAVINMAKGMGYKCTPMARAR